MGVQQRAFLRCAAALASLAVTGGSHAGASVSICEFDDCGADIGSFTAGLFFGAIAWGAAVLTRLLPDKIALAAIEAPVVYLVYLTYIRTGSLTYAILGLLGAQVWVLFLLSIRDPRQKGDYFTWENPFKYRPSEAQMAYRAFRQSIAEEDRRDSELAKAAAAGRAAGASAAPTGLDSDGGSGATGAQAASTVDSPKSAGEERHPPIRQRTDRAIHGRTTIDSAAEHDQSAPNRAAGAAPPNGPAPMSATDAAEARARKEERDLEREIEEYFDKWDAEMPAPGAGHRKSVYERIREKRLADPVSPTGEREPRPSQLASEEALSKLRQVAASCAAGPGCVVLTGQSQIRSVVIHGPDLRATVQRFIAWAASSGHGDSAWREFTSHGFFGLQASDFFAAADARTAEMIAANEAARRDAAKPGSVRIWT